MKSPFFQIKNPASASKFAASVAACLAFAKIYFYLQTGLLLVALSALDSAIDVCVSYINNRVILFARQRADDDHPYGHGKAESIAAMAQGMLIACASFGILLSSLQTFFFEQEAQITHHNLTKLIYFFIITAVFSFGITLVLKFYSRRFNSVALYGDSQHYFTDIFSNLGNALSIYAIAHFQARWLDPVIAGIISLYMLYNAYNLIRKTVDELMDHDLPETTKKEALLLIYATSPLIQDVHRFRGRRSGERLIFDFHISLPETLAFKEAHEIADAIEAKLADSMNADVIVHIDPLSVKQV